MPFRSHSGICYFEFDQFGGDIVHAVFTRKGGVSPVPWSALNVGGTVGDEPGRVSRNRQMALAALGRTPESVFDAWQVHGVNVAIANAPRPPETPHLQADVILTDKPGITLMMRFADCVPIFLHDPTRKVVGIAHAGWMGTVKGTARSAVQAMQERFGSAPADIQAAIGPSIGPDHYEVGPDVAGQVRQAFGSEAQELLVTRDGSIYFDLWKANTLILRKVGIHQIENAGLCTVCHNEDWYSHRAERGQTGRFGAIVALKE
jgi:polyphenol oxidase